MKLLSGNSNKPLSKSIAKYLKSKLVNSSIRNFSDGEIYVEINENIRGNSVFVIQSTSNPANDNLMELLLCIDALKRSSAKNIISKVIRFMIKKGSNPKNITAAIGPAISAKNYEVKEDFKRKFIKKDKKNNKFFKFKSKKLYFDLPKYVKSCLLKNKIKNIDSINIDTFDVKNNFFSARRALRLKHDDYGRNISIIMLN